jgi:Effector protein
MAWIAFKSYNNILVDNANAALYAKAVKGLEKIENMKSGIELLAAIKRALHRLEIKPIDGPGGSSTGYASSSNYTLLARAIKDQNAVLYQQELTAALGNAERKSGVTKQFVAGQLTSGLTPITYIGAKNVGAAVAPATATTPKAMLALLDDLTSGRTTTRPAGFDEAIQRILREWLTPGRGCATDIEINVERPSQCWSDGQKTLRYPTLCLAHELVHAWRGMTGRMLLVGSQDDSNDIEEVITTGLPPYNYETFSENIFRTQWPDEMPLRTSY